MRVLVPVLGLALLVVVAVMGAGVAGSGHEATVVRREPAAAGEPGRPPSSTCAEHGYGGPAAGGDEAVVALVRGPAGGVRAVSFEQGWRVYQGRRPGALVAVCRATRP